MFNPLPHRAPRPHSLSAVRVLALVLFALSVTALQAAQPLPVELEGVGVTEHIGEQIPLDLQFINEQGERVTLGTHFKQGHKPVVLMLVYYTCPMICNMTLNAFTKGIKDLDWTPGQEYEIVTVSIDPTETPELAASKKQNYLNDYGRPAGATGWHWYVGEEPMIRQLAAATGFNYKYDARQSEYAHSPVIFVLTPDGKMSRYLYGLNYPTRDLRFALLEASNGKFGTTLDRLLLFCYHYDPVQRTYAIYARQVMMLAGAVSVLVMGAAIGGMLWQERRKQLRRVAAASDKLSQPPAVGT